jgi:protein transport protein SEC61 subunit gamma-like protein
MSLIERRITEMLQTLRLAKKTSRDDYMQHLRLVLLGMATVGGLAFVIKLISEFITFGMSGRFASQ